ncbi:Dolichyl-phosphate-mannose-protein mannosyltransferase [Tritrichomonas foetus]|uniref:Dolichyl-phosphate-mannose-protein mannosyltransferase n=1 Tax=Tritrichomonas foetus TaxID=1144522 RepID=A0A1J4JZ37_9EUKA|nr:Dolichyl-phosphate-mannose-protein mannosyltransferase [Tritrichomonas foetus]|eukprot:OHT02796.1 Dolichyl-phosphate-mannose-protein mannosyltransferase [Tritrichomonas foetus]
MTLDNFSKIYSSVKWLINSEKVRLVRNHQMMSDELPISPEHESRHVFNFNFVSFKRLYFSIFPPQKTRRLELDAKDAVAILFFTALGVITRIFRIQYPKNVVFDELYFGNFTNYYLRGQYFHDIHPPLAKLIMVGMAHMAGYKGEYSFTGPEYKSMAYVALRMTPAFFGALCVPLSYLIMRAMLCSHFASFTAAILVMSDLVLIVEARHILSDGILHFFTCLSIFSIFLYERNFNIFFFIFEGICLGCVASCKYTSGGIVLLALIRQYCLNNNYDFKDDSREDLENDSENNIFKDVYKGNFNYDFDDEKKLNKDVKNMNEDEKNYQENRTDNFSERSLRLSRNSFQYSTIRAFFLCVIVGIIHLICFTVHLTILPYLPENESDLIVIPDCVKRGLVDRMNPNWDARSRAPSMIRRVITLIIYMHASNMQIGNSHPYASKCWTWPLFLSRWVLFWTNEGKHIICVGNVLLWYPVFFGIVVNLILTLMRKDFRKLRATVLIGYLLSYLPFFLIPREMFLYHYAIPLIFGIYNLSILIERELKPVYRGFIYSLVIVMALIGYILWNPWAYGLTTEDFDFLVWNNNWRG